MKKNESYRGFEVLDVFPVQYNDSQAVYLRHKKSGLEVLHLLNSDEENLFAFCFRTPPSDSTGAAHILEHSVLCGSRNFPAKDPFLQLRNQSISTYLNAYTAKDRTVYPASSLVKADYFTLMSVYADAVFFPLLRPEIFMQEGWRLETDADGRPCIQGVVFNEMKGNYSSFNSAATDAVMNAAAAGTCYEHDSGGDPLEIPHLSYEAFVSFHKKYYCTANCLVFLYGNIPTEEQLDFLDEHVVSQVSSFGTKCSLLDEDCGSSGRAGAMKRRISACGPAEGQKSTAALVWRIGNPAEKEDLFLRPMEISFLSELLFGNDSSPVIKRLLRKFPGCDSAPQTGCSIHSRFFSAAVALHGIPLSQASVFQSAVNDILKELLENGIPEEDIERSFMSFAFSIREVKRSPSRGPYSLVLLSRALRAWTYGAHPKETLSYIEAFEEISRKIRAGSSYLRRLIETYFVQNKNVSLVTVSPSAEWSRLRAEKESRLAQRLLARMGARTAAVQLEKMKSFQESADEELRLPVMSRAGMNSFGERIVTRKSKAGSVPLYINEECTNGIVYASVLFPVDTLRPCDYKFLPLLACCIPGIGTKTLSWEKTLSVSDCLMGDFGAVIRSAAVPESARSAAEKDPLIMGREWLSVHFKFLEEKSAEAFGFAGDVLSSVDFSDTKRLRTLVNSLCSGLSASVVPSGHYYAMLRSCRLLNRACAVQEIKDGLTAVFAAHEIKKMKTADIARKLSSLYKKIVSSGAVLHVTSDAEGIKESRRQFAVLSRRLGLSFPAEKRSSSDAAFFRQTELGSSSRRNRRSPVPVSEVFAVPGTVGFAAAAVESSGRRTRNIMADTVFAHLAESSDLWSRIRTEGGAYGAFLSVKSSCSATCFATYRDPRPFESLAYFHSFLQSAKERTFSDDEIEKPVAGVYSDEIEPYTPALKGGTGLMRRLYGGSAEQDRLRIQSLLKITGKDIEKAARRYGTARFAGTSVVICGKSMISQKNAEFSGKIVTIPL